MNSKAVLRSPWFAPLVALLLCYALFSGLAPETFPGATNLWTMARQTVVVAIAAVGMTYVILLGGIDLSVGSGVAITTVVVAALLRQGVGPASAVACQLAPAAVAYCTDQPVRSTVPEPRFRSST